MGVPSNLVFIIVLRKQLFFFFLLEELKKLVFVTLGLAY